MSNNYIGKNSLARFLENLYETFSKKGHAHSKADILDFPDVDDTLTMSGAIADAKAVGDSLVEKISYVPQELTEEQKVQARKNIGIEYTEEDAIQLAIETELIAPVALASGELLLDKNNILFTL